MRRLIARRGRKMLRFDSWGSLRGHFFGCLPLGFVRKGSVTRLDGCDCALASGGGVGSMSDSRPELRSSVGSRPALSQEGSTKSVQMGTCPHRYPPMEAPAHAA